MSRAQKDFPEESRRRSRQGATVIEYAILASLISVAAITIIVQVGRKVVTMFTTAASAPW